MTSGILPPNVPDDSPWTVAVVEDDVGLLHLIRKELEREGFSTTTATGADEAVRRIVERGPERLLLLLDYRLGNRTGREVLDALEGAGIPVPFIVATGHGDEKTAVEMMKKGALDYLVKDSGFLARLPSVVRRTINQIELEAQYRQTQVQLRQAQKMEAIGRLAAGIAHDFNNLLTAITGYCELLLSRIPPSDPNRRDIDEIRSAGNRAAEMTRQLLAFSRKQVLQPRIIDLNAIVAGIEKMLRRLIGEDVILRISPGEDLWPTLADPGQIEQVLLNLAVNARDAMPRGGTIVVTTANADFGAEAAHGEELPLSGPYVVLSVRDTGVGMDAATLSRIFEPFFTTKEVGKGTGLGLAMTYGIVRQSNGHIRAESVPGQGTTFRIYLPKASGEGADATASAASPPAKRKPSGSETVLLVEDSDMVRGLVKHILSLGGFTVLEAGNGEEALRIFRSHEGAIDIMLTDVVMPHMSGRELARHLRTVRPQARILFMSGYTEDNVGRDGGLPEGTSFIPKPFTPDALLRKVREVLEEPVYGG